MGEVNYHPKPVHLLYQCLESFCQRRQDNMYDTSLKDNMYDTSLKDNMYDISLKDNMYMIHLQSIKFYYKFGIQAGLVKNFH